MRALLLLSIAAYAFCNANLSTDIRFAAFSDIHAEPRYNASQSNIDYCKGNGPSNFPQDMSNLTDFISKDFAPLGRHFCNPPPLLFETMLKSLKEKETRINS
jgi:hypothetical protein